MNKNDFLSVDIDYYVVPTPEEDKPFERLIMKTFMLYEKKIGKNIGDLTQEEQEIVIKQTIKEAKEKNIYIPESYREYETD